MGPIGRLHLLSVLDSSGTWFWPDTWQAIESNLDRPEGIILTAARIAYFLQNKRDLPAGIWKHAARFLATSYISDGSRENFLSAMALQPSWPDHVWKLIPDLLKMELDGGMPDQTLNALHALPVWPKKFCDEVPAALISFNSVRQAKLIRALYLKPGGGIGPQSIKENWPDYVWDLTLTILKNESHNDHNLISKVLNFYPQSWPEKFTREIRTLVVGPKHSSWKDLLRQAYLSRTQHQTHIPNVVRSVALTCEGLLKRMANIAPKGE